ncbi:hypothetical protein GC090_23220 (plasmid) [Pantoea sp. JZ29]|uniref:hypothetical protein n=1 Tax=unclassified Pantoea TaxID=2630326 RepID=UPI002B474C9C|nr:hypothetical protein [Pantoea sp. JZ29]WRH23545.1 hypothetical protein GC090_23220 [Pantoea sp. JZ29]
MNQVLNRADAPVSRHADMYLEALDAVLSGHLIHTSSIGCNGLATLKRIQAIQANAIDTAKFSNSIRAKQS